MGSVASGLVPPRIQSTPAMSAASNRPDLRSRLSDTTSSMVTKPASCAASLISFCRAGVAPTLFEAEVSAGRWGERGNVLRGIRHVASCWVSMKHEIDHLLVSSAVRVVG